MVILIAGLGLGVVDLRGLQGDGRDGLEVPRLTPVGPRLPHRDHQRGGGVLAQGIGGLLLLTRGLVVGDGLQAIEDAHHPADAAGQIAVRRDEVAPRVGPAAGDRKRGQEVRQRRQRLDLPQRDGQVAGPHLLTGHKGRPEPLLQRQRQRVLARLRRPLALGVHRPPRQGLHGQEALAVERRRGVGERVEVHQIQEVGLGGEGVVARHLRVVKVVLMEGPGPRGLAPQG